MISQIWEATTAKRMQTDLYHQRQNCSTLNVPFTFSGTYYHDIAGRSSARGLQSEYYLLAKTAIFSLYASISRKRYEIRPKLLLMSNRKLHMRFRLALRSMTLDDLELL